MRPKDRVLQFVHPNAVDGSRLRRTREVSIPGRKRLSERLNCRIGELQPSDEARQYLTPGQRRVVLLHALEIVQRELLLTIQSLLDTDKTKGRGPLEANGMGIAFRQD